MVVPAGWLLFGIKMRSPSPFNWMLSVLVPFAINVPSTRKAAPEPIFTVTPGSIVKVAPFCTVTVPVIV